jgi:hypothetical protein
MQPLPLAAREDHDEDLAGVEIGKGLHAVVLGRTAQSGRA